MKKLAHSPYKTIRIKYTGAASTSQNLIFNKHLTHLYEIPPPTPPKKWKYFKLKHGKIQREIMKLNIDHLLASFNMLYSIEFTGLYLSN
jgi:hypothetical protein